MRRAFETFSHRLWLALALVFGAVQQPVWSAPTQACTKPVYLTFDTGHMGVAPLIAEVLRRQEVKVTFFLANEPTQEGGSSLDEHWAPWWRERVAEGHAFGSHTWDHWSLLPDAQGRYSSTPPWRFAVQPHGSARRSFTADAQAYCEQLRKPAQRFKDMTGASFGAVFRAPGGRTSPSLRQAAQQCGYEHVHWAEAGFLGDELPSDRYPNAQLLQRALQGIRPGDILVAHLGIWSRQDPWAPAVLEPLITGLKAKGYCFATLREHPQYRTAWSSP